MRRYARMAAASIVIILGLALVAVSSVGANPSNPIGRPDVPDDEAVEAVAPVTPSRSNQAALQRKLNPDSFDSEFGQRGKHEVQVRVTGAPLYAISWRDEPETEWGVGDVQRRRTINSGFPVVQVAVNGGGRLVTCSITVDGEEKDYQTTNTKQTIVFCEA